MDSLNIYLVFSDCTKENSNKTAPKQDSYTYKDFCYGGLLKRHVKCQNQSGIVMVGLQTVKRNVISMQKKQNTG